MAPPRSRAELDANNRRQRAAPTAAGAAGPRQPPPSPLGRASRRTPGAAAKLDVSATDAAVAGHTEEQARREARARPPAGRAEQPRARGVRARKSADPASTHADPVFPHADLAISDKDLAAGHALSAAARREEGGGRKGLGEEGKEGASWRPRRRPPRCSPDFRWATLAVARAGRGRRGWLRRGTGSRPCRPAGRRGGRKLILVCFS